MSGIRTLVFLGSTRISLLRGIAAVRSISESVPGGQLLILLGLLCLLLIGFDFSGGTSVFWQHHPVTTSLLTGAIFSVGLAVVMERTLTARERRIRTPLGAAACHEIGTAVCADEVLQVRVLDYCCRTYGDSEVPSGKDYFDDMLLEALGDPRTWESIEEVPSLLDQLIECYEELNQKFLDWAPILAVAPELRGVTTYASHLINATGGIIGGLYMLMGFPVMQPAEWREEAEERGLQMLTIAILKHRTAEEGLRLQIAEYEGSSAFNVRP